MFLTLDNTASGFDYYLKNLNEYDFFFITSSLENDFITLSCETTFKLFNDCLHASLKREKPVFILENSSEFDGAWLDLVVGKDYLIHDNFIFINTSIQSKIKDLKPIEEATLNLKVLSKNYSQL